MTYLTPNTKIPATDGDMDAFVILPPEGVKATVIMQVELWGMTLHMQEVAHRLAAEGYAAVVIDLFRGAHPPVPSDPHEKWAKTFEGFSDIRATLDSRHALSWVLDGGLGCDPGKVFAWGFCMGGRFAHNLAAFDPRLTGAINFYGRVNYPRMDNKPFLPIEVTQMIECAYLGAFAETDGLIPPEDVAQVTKDLASNSKAEIRVYEGTEHAFFNDHREAYHAGAAAKAWQHVLDFLQKHG
ncbi:dienelactone hydrolase family protein [Cognatishimia activa]|uniref:Carboxymethylenebutenolidase n=1 Tax=Cognatishimia activa TaxID=1715691 RepID=A0A0N7MBS4_9RHOB|nr:dienelactone hydrolase family protein [Cognatishimia activa]MEE2944213.1 dienelactone hydrolase family protein [Pseudomonadota bacterium]CUJ00036.1 Carboxymethylenebutenolidase [Cognatishimia activa]CUK26216.1 Carboxymethylenebutenolidase [Cognatishimia activa]